MRRAPLPSRCATALLAAGVLAAACSGPPVYAPDSADVVVATKLDGATVSMTLAPGSTLDLDSAMFLGGVGSGASFLLLRGSSPKAWAMQVFPSGQAYTDAGCFGLVGVVSDAGDRLEVLVGFGGVPVGDPHQIRLRLPKAASFTNNYLPSLGSTASGNLACLDAHGQVTSTW